MSSGRLLATLLELMESASAMSLAQYFVSITTNTDPTNAPVRLPRPPMTTAARISSDNVRLNAPGDALFNAKASSAPPTPAQAALTTNASTCTRGTDRPDSDAATSSSRTARIERPTRLRIRLAVNHSSTIVQTRPTNSGHWTKSNPLGCKGGVTDKPWLPLR